jgi:DNA-binding phage protein
MSIARHHTLALLVGASLPLLLLLGPAATRRAARPAPTGAPLARPCAMPEGSAGAYLIHHDAEVMVRPSGFVRALAEQRGANEATRRREALDGLLSWEVRTDGVVAAQLVATSPHGEVREQLGLRLSPDCKVLAFGMAPASSTERVERVRMLVRALDVQLDSGARWEATHEDGLGRYRARYEARGGVIRRSHLGYDAPAGAPTHAPQLQVQRGSAMITPSALGWLDQVQSAQRVVVRERGELLLEAEDSHLLRRVRATRQVPALGALRWVGLGQRWAQPAPQQAVPGAQTSQPSFEDARAALRARLDEESGQAMAVELMTRLFASPEQRARWIRALRAGELERREEELVFHALRLVGDEAALDELSRDMGLSRENAARAYHALARLEQPGDATREALIHAATHSADPERQRMATIALGTYARGAAGRGVQDDALAAEAVLRDALGSADQDRVSAALAASANARSARMLEAVTPHLESGASTARMLAAAAIGKTPGEAALGMLVPLVTSDPAAEVRAAASRALAARVETQPDATTDAQIIALCAALAGEPRAQVRAALIEVLGALVDQHIDARAALIAQYSREPEDANRVLIGRFISASELGR